MKRQRKLNPFYVYSVYVDTPEYLADTIINDICLPLQVVKERYMNIDDRNYVLIKVKFSRKYIGRYKKFLEILKFYMLLYNREYYLQDTKRLLERLNNDKVFGGNWS